MVHPEPQPGATDPLLTGQLLLGRRLRRARAERQLLLVDAAAATGLSMQYISEIERGNRLPSLGALKALADAYGVLVTDVLTGLYPFGTRRRPRRPVRPSEDGRRYSDT